MVRRNADHAPPARPPRTEPNLAPPIEIVVSGSLRIRGSAHGEFISNDSTYFRKFAERLEGEHDGYILDEVLTPLSMAVRGLDLRAPLDALEWARFLFWPRKLKGTWPPLHPGDQVKANRKHNRDLDALGRLENVKDFVLRLAVHSALPSEVDRHPEIQFARTMLREEPGRPLEHLSDRCVRGFSAALSLLCARVADELRVRENAVAAAAIAAPTPTVPTPDPHSGASQALDFDSLRRAVTFRSEPLAYRRAKTEKSCWVTPRHLGLVALIRPTSVRARQATPQSLHDINQALRAADLREIRVSRRAGDISVKGFIGITAALAAAVDAAIRNQR